MLQARYGSRCRLPGQFDGREFWMGLEEFRRVPPYSAQRGERFDRLALDELQVCQTKPGSLISGIKLKPASEFCFCLLQFSRMQIGFAQHGMQSELQRIYPESLLIFLRGVDPAIAFQ